MYSMYVCVYIHMYLHTLQVYIDTFQLVDFNSYKSSNFFSVCECTNTRTHVSTYLIVSVCLRVCFYSKFLIQQIESVLQHQVMCFLLIFGRTIAPGPYKRYGKVSDHT